MDEFIIEHADLLDSISPGLELGEINGMKLASALRCIDHDLDEEQVEIAIIKASIILGNPNLQYQDLYKENFIVILILGNYFRDIQQSSHSKEMAPKVGHQTPRICSAVAGAVKSIQEPETNDATANIGAKHFPYLSKLKSLLRRMISLKSWRGEND